MRQRRELSFALAFLFSSVFICVTYAQNSNVNVSGNLIYVRRSLDVKTEYVSAFSNVSQVFTLPHNQCSNISQSGTYVATTNLQRGDLIVRRFKTQEIIWQFPWAADWDPCYFFWISDNVLSMGSASSYSTQTYRLDVFTGQITAYTPPSYTPLPPPQLPNWLPSGSVLPSPDGNKFLYNRCTSGQTETTPDGVYCAVPPDWVIYDASQQPALQVLTDITLIGANKYGFYAGTTWSPDGRYLAYLRERNFALRIYDTIAHQSLDTSGIGGVSIDLSKGLNWSPDGTKVAVWVVGRLAEPQPGDDDTTLRQLLIFNTMQSGIAGYTLASQAVNLGGITVPPEKDFWSPDSHAFAFIDHTRSLYYVDTATGETALLDNNVDDIITWNRQSSP